MVYYAGIEVKMNLNKLFYWLLGLFVLYLIIELIRKILGGNLSYETLIIGLLIANIGYTITLYTKLADVNAKLSGHLGWHKGNNSKSRK